jgi:hypothetical protein
MKQCPVCKATYADETLNFCLSDGSTLFAMVDEEPTRVVSSGGNPVRIDVARETSPIFTPSVTSNQSAPGGSSKTVSLLVGLLALVILAFAGFAAFMLLKPDDNTKSNTTGTPTISQTPDDEIAKLKKQVEDLKNQKSPTPVPTIPARKETGNTARVSSPSDGFLALRSEPNSETGYRIAQIPDGASVNVAGCQSFSVKIGRRTGRWCQVEYGGQSGWAFDAFLVY